MDIVDFILDLSIPDITNPELFKHKVKNIPLEFLSLDHYLDSFRFPVIEEARAQLSECLTTLSSAPYVGIIVESCHVIFSFSIYCAEQRGNYVPKVGDIVLLSPFVPKNMEDLQKGVCLTVLNEISSDGRCMGKLGTYGRKGITGGGTSYLAVYLMNIIELNNIWKSLNVDTNDSRTNFVLIRKALNCDYLADKSSTRTSLHLEDVVCGTILSKLNESQISAVGSVVSSIRSTHPVSLHTFSGLPGTGKTELACIIALAALRLRKKVIVCVPAKYSVTDIASRFLKIVEVSHEGLNLNDIVICEDSDENSFVPVATEKHGTGEFSLGKFQLVFCNVSRLLKLNEIVSMGVLIMDNASRMKECEVVLPLQMKGLRHVVLLGNDDELQPTVKSQISEAAGLARSLFERMRASLFPSNKLYDIQYRMHPEISYFPNKRFWRGKLKNGVNVMNTIHSVSRLAEPIYKPFSFLDVADGKEIMKDEGDDWENVVEAAVVIRILAKLFHARLSSGGRLSVGVISPYKSQVQTIQNILAERIESSTEFSMWVKSLDAVEISEADVIIFSTVRCNDSGSVGILANPHLTEIGLTRARQYLWIIGNQKTLVKSNSIWEELVHDAMKRGCVFNVGDDKDLAGVVCDIKRELDELDDLLNLESVLFNDKKWKIIFSDDFKLSFIALKSRFVKQIVLAFLLRLANGWRPKHRCMYSLKPSLAKYVKLYKVHGLYLVCTTDIVNDSKYTQVLRIWDILQLVDIPKLVEKLEAMISACSAYYMKHCLEAKYEGNLVVPMSWSACSEILKSDSIGSSVSSVQCSEVSENMLLMKFYSLSSTSFKNLLRVSDENEIELPFEVSEMELEIIQHPRSAFVLGRSGTGKTIISIMKLMQREQEYMDAVHGLVPYSYRNKSLEIHDGIRQIFVTASVTLCSAVRNYMSRLKRCISGEIHTDSNESGMHEAEDSFSMFSDIPDSFVHIPLRYFPLVVSLDKFLRMLDGSLSFSYFDRFRDLKVIGDGKRSSRSLTKEQLIQGKEVRYDRFLTSYWPCFNAKYTRKLNPMLVFTQIISFIKGGCRLGKAHRHEKMDEDTYISLSESHKSNLSRETRQIIYKIFLDYEKKKQRNGEYDVSDLAIDIHSRLKFEGYGGEMMDFVYIDEVQDLTINQLSLFKYICSNAKEGFMFSGDTAQTITKGVDFRFQDIRSLFYTDFLVGSERSSDLFKLKQNFRTHSAVLNLAESVLTLLYYFFPLSVDKLESETSILHGELPVLLDTSDKNVLKNLFSSNVPNGECLITFGAQQVILVRDDLVKKEVIEQIGSSALVLTIIECKGLEFQDVLLYKFFENSSLRDTWEVLYEFMDHKSLLDSSELKYLHFNKDKHNALCSELKELYVAISRTRKRLWILDNFSTAKPLLALWKKLDVVKQGKFEPSFSGKMQVFCKAEEWKLRGQKFFKEGNYETSTFCFKQSGDVYLWKWAKAASLQTEGQNKRKRDPEKALSCLAEAATLYEQIEKMELSAFCYIQSENYFKAANIYITKFQTPRYEDAGDCLVLARCWSDAAKTYAQGVCLSKCLSACKKGFLFKLGWDFLKSWSENVMVDCKVDFLMSWISKIYNFSNITWVLENARVFPKDGYALLLEEGRFVEASIIQRIKGEVLLAADLHERAGEYDKSTKLLVFYITIQVISIDEKQGVTMQHSHNLDLMFEKAEELATEVPNPYGEDALAELKFLSDRTWSFSNVIRHQQRNQDLRNVFVDMFSARAILEVYLKVDVSQYCCDADAIFKWRSFDLEKLIFEGYNSAQVLLNAWNIWNRHISSLFSYLQGAINRSHHNDYRDLCMKLFGVLNVNNQELYVAFNSQASWINSTYLNKEALHMIGHKVYMSGEVFKSLAQQFLRGEVSSLCNKLLSILTKLQNVDEERRIFSIQKTVLSLQIYGIQRFHAMYGDGTSMSFGVTNGDVSMALSPLHCTGSMVQSKQDSDLQEKNTAVKAVGLVLHENLKFTQRKAIPTRIGWSILFLFLSSNLTEELTWQVRKKSGLHSPWKNFYEQLLEYKDTSFTDASGLAHTFLDTTQTMFPLDQLLLIETLVFLASSCQIGRGWFVTSKLMLSKSIFSKNSESFHFAFSESFGEVDSQSIRPLYDFMLTVVCEMLSKRRFLWLTRYKKKAKKFQQALVLRLVSLLCFICLNSEDQFVQVQKILKHFAAGFLSLLPPRFQLAVRYMTRFSDPSFQIFSFLFSKALEATVDRLVLVRKDDNGEPVKFLRPMVLDNSFFNQNKEKQQVLMWFASQ